MVLVTLTTSLKEVCEMSTLAELVELAFALLGVGTILKDNYDYVICEVRLIDGGVRDAFFKALGRAFYVDFFAEKDGWAYFNVEELNPIVPFRSPVQRKT
jgi:hypothetical protein